MQFLISERGCYFNVASIHSLEWIDSLNYGAGIQIEYANFQQFVNVLKCTKAEAELVLRRLTTDINDRVYAGDHDLVGMPRAFKFHLATYLDAIRNPARYDDSAEKTL